ncbi:flagellar hook-associated protein FlgL [Blastococcus jejuensis]|uniref:Flagellar hook-associated protein FlgL n=1 Tax=Blastococcus jejuensis TaxID=351224 RepID=A0ABP6PAA1_9ACTN
MRITQRAVALTSLQGLNRNLDAVGKLQQQLTSGRLINAPSDSPTGTNRAMQTRAEQAATAQQARNITDAKSWLEQTDSALQEMSDTARRVRDLTVQGSSTGSNSTSSMQALATEVASLRQGLLSLANGTVQGRPLFGGVTSGPKAYDSTTGAWLGQGGAPVTRRVSDTESIRVDLTGPEAFGPPGSDLFAIVDRIATNMVTDPTLLATDLADLDVAMKNMSGALADVGSRAARIDRVEQVNADRQLTLSSQLAETENIDLPNTIMRLQMQQVGYEAALQATAKALQPTLLDFLR